MENNKTYTDGLKAKTAAELVELFNKEVGVTHWVSARGHHLMALRHAFAAQGIDYSAVTNGSGGFNLAKGNEVVLKKGVLTLIAQHS